MDHPCQLAAFGACLPHFSKLLCRYQSTQLGNFQTVELIETFVNYQESIKRCVCIVYDPQRSSHGGLSIKAVKLKDSFIGAYKGDGVLTIEKVTAGSIT